MCSSDLLFSSVGKLWLKAVYQVVIFVSEICQFYVCERFEPRSHFKSRLSLIVRVNVLLNRTVVVDSDRRFDKLCGSHLQSQTGAPNENIVQNHLNIELLNVF